MRIHIIDDNVDIAEMLKLYFTKKGHDCSISTNGRTGLAILQTQKFDAIILDIAMPGFSGLDVIENLYENNRMNEMNIVALTASMVPPLTHERMLQLGVKAILRKPMDPDEILEQLSQIIPSEQT